MMLDATQKIRKDFGVRLFPTKILISPEGKVVTKPGGADAIDQLDAELKRVVR